MSALSIIGKLGLFALVAVGILCPHHAWASDKVRIALSVRNVVLLPFYYAKDRKIFDKQGLDVEIIQMRSNLQLAGVASGELDFMVGVGTAVTGISNGMPLKIVAVLYRSPLFSVVSAGHVKNLKDLEGKKISVSRIGSESHTAAVWMFKNSGADFRRATFIQTASTAVNMIALQQGSVDAAVLSPPFTGEMVEKGYKILAKSGDLVEAPFNGLVTTREKIQRRPEMVKNVLKALLESLRVIRHDRQTVLEYIRENFKVSPKVAEESYEDILGVMIENLIMPEERLKIYLESGYTDIKGTKLIPPSEMVDYSMLRGMK